MASHDLSHIVDQIKARLKVSDVVGARVKLKKRGREYVGLCPFHKEKTPSFCAMDHKGFYYCFGCGASGDIIQFVMQMDKTDFATTIKTLATKAGVTLPPSFLESKRRADGDTRGEDGGGGVNSGGASLGHGVQKVDRDKLLRDVLTSATSFFSEALKRAPHALSYLQDRGISAATQSAFSLGYAPSDSGAIQAWGRGSNIDQDLLVEAGLLGQDEETGRIFPRFRDRLLFPIHSPRGQVVGFGGRLLPSTGQGMGRTVRQAKYLNSPDAPHFRKGMLLYGLHSLLKPQQGQRRSDDDKLLIVEGYMDVLALHQQGFQAVAPLGTALGETQLTLAWRVSSEPILCFDGDEAGRRAALRSLDRLVPILKPGHTASFVFLPEGEDPDSLVTNHGAHRMRALCDKAQPLVEVWWHHLLDNAVGRQDFHRHFNRPEARAKFRQDVFQAVGSIQDEAVRQAYKAEFQSRLYALFDGSGRRSSPQSSSDASNRGFSPRDQERRRRHGAPAPQDSLLGALHDDQKGRLLLATLYHHPDIFEDVEPDLYHMPVKGDMKMALAAIIDGIFAHHDAAPSSDEVTDKGHEKPAMIDSKATSGVDDIQNYLACLSDSSVFTLAPFAHPKASHEEALAGWRRLWEHYATAKTIDEELLKLADTLKKNPSPKDWERFKALTLAKQKAPS